MPDGTGRLLLRYSGTEPNVLVMIEGEDQNEIKALADGLAGIIRRSWVRITVQISTGNIKSQMMVRKRSGIC